MMLPAPTKKRVRIHECGRWLRRVKGARYQVRVWLDLRLGRGLGHVNAGLYRDEWTANRVVKMLVKRRFELTPLGLWYAVRSVLAELAAKGHEELPDPMPRYVRRYPNEFKNTHGKPEPNPAYRGCSGFYAKVKLRGKEIVCAGPFTDPVDAHLAMLERLAREWPEFRALLAATRRGLSAQATA